MEAFFLPMALRRVSASPPVKPAHFLGNLHHLLLVHQHAVGVFEGVFHRRVDVGDGSAAVFALDEVLDPLHGTGAVEGDHGDDVVEHGGFEVAEVALHAGRFQLEHAGGVAGAEQLEGLGVVQRKAGDIDVGAVDFADDAQRIVDDGEVGQAEEIHFEQAELLDRAHGVLRGEAAFLGALERHVGNDWLGRNHHAGRVHSIRTYGALQADGLVDELLGAGVALVFLYQIGLGTLLEALAGFEAHRHSQRNVAALHRHAVPVLAMRSTSS